MKKGGSVYIITNKHNTTLYTGVTSDLVGRIWNHKNQIFPKSFSKKYNLTKLVFYENFPGILEAIAREKQIKSWSRIKKIKLIESFNPEWIDVYYKIFEEEARG